MSYFFPSGYKVCTDWFGKCYKKTFVSFAFLKELLTLELRVCTEKLVTTPFKSHIFSQI